MAETNESEKQGSVAPDKQNQNVGGNNVGGNSAAGSGRRNDGSASQKSKSGLGLVWLVLLLLIGTTGTGVYFAWHWFQQYDFTVLQVENNGDQQQQSELNAINVALQSERQLRGQLQEELTQTNAATRAELNRLATRMESIAGGNIDDWRLAEAEYLLRLANQRLIVEQTGDTVLPLMLRADNILRGLDDSNLVLVRQALAADITAIKMLGSVDREGIYLRLSALKGAIDKLSTVPVPEVLTDTSAKAGIEADTRIVAQANIDTAWERFVENASSALNRFSKDHFQVRSLNAPMQAMISPDQEVYLRQNLQLMLSQAQVALLERQPRVYQDSLDTASGWLKSYFQLDDQSRFFVAQLEELGGQKINTALPNIAGSIDHLKDYLDRRTKVRSVHREGDGS